MVFSFQHVHVGDVRHRVVLRAQLSEQPGGVCDFQQRHQLRQRGARLPHHRGVPDQLEGDGRGRVHDRRATRRNHRQHRDRHPARHVLPRAHLHHRRFAHRSHQ